MSDIVPPATSPATLAETGDGKKTGNITAEQATRKLFEKYTSTPPEPTPEPPTPVATDVVTPPAGAVDAAPSSVTEPPADTTTVTEPEAAPAGGETETEAQGEDVLSHDTTLTPEEREKFRAVTERWQEGVNKRIGKEKQKRLDAETKAKDLEAKLSQAPAAPEPVVVTAPTPESPLADVVDFNSLAKRQKEANDAIDSAQTLLDNLEDSGQSEVQIGQQTYTKPALREIKRNAEKTLREHIPARNSFLVKQQEAARALATDFPELRDRNGAAYREVQKVKAMYPVLAHMPDSDYWIALALAGAPVVAARKGGKANGIAPVTKPTPPAPSNKPPAAPIAASAAVNAASRGKINPQQAVEAERKKVFSGRNVSAAQATELLRKAELSKIR